MYQCIEAWLKAGIMESKNGPFPPFNTMGTPQGGVCSPLLANIALDGLERTILKGILTHPTLKNKVKNGEQTKIVRYADDFIILAPTMEVLKISINLAKQFLGNIGLEITELKSRILHTLDKTVALEKTNKFRFLGMLIYQIKVGKYRMGKASGGRKVPWAVKVIPHPDKVKEHFNTLRKIIKTSTSSLQLITRANPVIRGWRNYFCKSDGSTSGLVASLNKRLYLLLSNWVKRTFKTRKRIEKV